MLTKAQSTDPLVSGWAAEPDATVPAAGPAPVHVAPALASVPDPEPEVEPEVAQPEPVAPDEPDEVATSEPQTPVAEPLQVAAPTAPAPAGEGNAPAKPAKVRKEKITFTIDPEEAERARAAYVNLPFSARPRSFSDFIASAVVVQTRAVEAEFNDGAPFGSVRAGQIPTGRPPGL